MTATAYIVAARRTPIGKFMGGLAKVPAPVLGSYVGKALLAECPGAAAHVDEFHGGPDSRLCVVAF